MNTKEKFLIIIPAYNEEKSALKVIDKIQSNLPNIDIVVIDDKSTDDTLKILRTKSISILPLPINLGYGAAIETGYLYAFQNNYDAVIQLDADGQHRPEDIVTFIEEYRKKDSDIILGSRFLNPESYKPPIARRIGMIFFSTLISLFAKINITDPTTGFQMVNRKIIAYYIKNKVFPSDYPDADILILLKKLGFNIKEVPVKMYANNENKSMHSGLKPLYYVIKVSLSIFIVLISNLKKGK
jgi:glycosyltransferase involved in cell wall biosynthesis